MSEYSSMAMFVGTIPLTPIPPRPQRKTSQQQKEQHPQKQNKKEKQSLTNLSSSPSQRRSFQRHSRQSSGSYASQSSHETAARPTDRPAAASSAAVGLDQTATAHQQLRSHPHPHHQHQHPTSSMASAASKSSSHKNRPRLIAELHPFDPRNALSLQDHGLTKTVSADRTESISSVSGATTLSARTMASSDPPVSGDAAPSRKPFALRNGRTYINDPTMIYPLPSDLTELHRQSLRTLLLIQVFGAPVCSPSLLKKPPLRVLELGCGSGFWSMMCHRYFKSRGHSGISFTGIDIVPLAPNSAKTGADAIKPDPDMNWKFIQHDLRQQPWPLPDNEFDLVMVKDMGLAVTHTSLQGFIDEELRVLKPGGTLEIWESDHHIRMLRPHIPSSGDDAEEQEAASSLGAYVMAANLPLSAPLNTFLVEYNQWLSKALETRDLTAVPCTVIGPTLLQESETLSKVRSRRLAIPLSEVRWEREGVGGVITKDGKSFVEMKGKSAPHHMVEKKSLSAGQSALRKTALLIVVQQVQAMEPILREISGKSQDEWDVWLSKMMNDLMSESGTSWGECLEVGAWWAKKKMDDED